MSGNDAADVVSDIEPDESLVFFHTSGWFDAAKQGWHLPVHGWIYEPEDSKLRSAAFEKILNEKYELFVTGETKANFSRRLNLTIADNERGRRIVVNVAGRRYELPESQENGHFEKTIVIPADDAAKHTKNGLIVYSAITGDNESRDFTGTVRLLEPAGLSVISDIDDTVKISGVGSHKDLLEHTFLLDFVAAPGMAELYRDWSNDEVAFHFVSSSPWQLYEPLSEFLAERGFPWATLSLKSVRFRDETLLDLFKKGTETKPRAIEKILDRYPTRQFILVGDSGEQGCKSIVFHACLRDVPDIDLRDLPGTAAHYCRVDLRVLFANIGPGRWQLFDDPQTLTLPLAR